MPRVASTTHSIHAPAPSQESDAGGRHQEKGGGLWRRLGKCSVRDQAMSCGGGMDGVPEEVPFAVENAVAHGAARDIREAEVSWARLHVVKQRSDVHLIDRDTEFVLQLVKLGF